MGWNPLIELGLVVQTNGATSKEGKADAFYRMQISLRVAFKQIYTKVLCARYGILWGLSLRYQGIGVEAE